MLVGVELRVVQLYGDEPNDSCEDLQMQYTDLNQLALECQPVVMDPALRKTETLSGRRLLVLQKLTVEWTRTKLLGLLHQPLGALLLLAGVCLHTQHGRYYRFTCDVQGTAKASSLDSIPFNMFVGKLCGCRSCAYAALLKFSPCIMAHHRRLRKRRGAASQSSLPMPLSTARAKPVFAASELQTRSVAEVSCASPLRVSLFSSGPTRTALFDPWREGKAWAILGCLASVRARSHSATVRITAECQIYRPAAFKTRVSCTS